MAEEKEKPKSEASKEYKLKQQKEEEFLESLIRIYGKDIPGNKKVYPGLTYIKGVSWAVSNAICKILKINKDTKISDLTKKQIDEIESFFQKPTLYNYMKNRQKDYDTGESKHILTNELDMIKDFDIKRMKQIKSYKGLRHSLKQPVRGQRTRSHFRVTKVAMGVKKAAK